MWWEMGAYQWISGRADHPNQNKQMGIQKAPTKAGGKRFSGAISAFSLNWGSVYLWRYQKNGGLVGG